MQLDESNGNNKWGEAEELERTHLFNYNAFKDLGKQVKTVVKPSWLWGDCTLMIK